MGSRLTRAMLCTGFALLEACSSVSTDVEPAQQSNAAKAAATSWVANGLPVHTRLSATKDSIVYGGVQKNMLYVVALDPATGKERWRRSSDVSGRYLGEQQTILTDDDTAYFLAGPRSGEADLIAVTSATGEERWRTTLLVQSAEPSATSCGDSICIVVAKCECNSPDLLQYPHTELWKLTKAEGRITGYYVIAGDAGRGDAVLKIDPSNSADAKVLVASFGTVYVTQFLHLGETKTWSKPAAELFGPTTVTMNGGWGGWRVADGWIAWIGTRTSEGTLEAGEAFPSGVIAAFDDRGKSRWIAAGRHPCWMVEFDAAVVLCDGEFRMLSETQAEIRPHVAEGRDPITGAVTWRLDLNGEIAEDDSEKVVRIDTSHYLIDLST